MDRNNGKSYEKHRSNGLTENNFKPYKLRLCCGEKGYYNEKIQKVIYDPVGGLYDMHSVAAVRLCRRYNIL